MGAVQRKLMLFASGNTHSQIYDEPKTYSWDAKPKVDAANYTVVNAKDVSITKPPGSIGGEQFIIRNCHVSKVSLPANGPCDAGEKDFQGVRDGSVSSRMILSSI